MPEQTNLFLTTMFAGKPPTSYTLIWSKSESEKVSQWFQNIDKVNIDDKLETHDIYFGVGLSPKNFGARRRCFASEIIGIPGLWIDIDISDGIHKKANLPPTLDDALELVGECPFKPSILVRTGGGIQAYWLFNDLWIFEDNSERSTAAELVTKWTYKFKELAAAHYWDIDSTQDLARVMRLPGTFNLKSKTPRPVEILDFATTRYSRVELAEWVESVVIPEKSKKAPKTATAGDFSGSYTLSLTATPDLERLEMLEEIYPKFKTTWNHRRRDFQDQSLSVYDLSLAAICIGAAWSDQEIVDLLIYHRRKYGDEKTDGRGNLRRDYYDRTLARAHGLVERGLVDEPAPDDVIVDQVAEDESPGIKSVLDEIDDEKSNERRAELLDKVSKRLTIPITRIARVHAEPIYFRLELASGQKIKLGDGGVILNQTLMRGKIATAALIAIPQLSKAAWFTTASQLLSCAEDEAPDPLETGSGFVKYWVTRYLAENNPILKSTDPTVYTEQSPFAWSSNVYILYGGFQAWLKRRDQNLKILNHEALRAAGLTTEIRRITRPGGFTTTNAWRIPDHILDGLNITVDNRE